MPIEQHESVCVIRSSLQSCLWVLIGCQSAPIKMQRSGGRKSGAGVSRGDASVPTHTGSESVSADGAKSSVTSRRVMFVCFGFFFLIPKIKVHALTEPIITPNIEGRTDR